GLARALQAHHQDHDGRDGVEVEVGDGAAQHLDQVIVDDLDDHLARRDRADDVGADRLGADPVDELADDRQGHVGFEEGRADLAQGRVDIGLGERTAPAKLVEYVTQTFAQTLEHLARRPYVRPNTYRADARTFADQRSSPTGEPLNRHDRLNGRGIRPTGQGVKRLGGRR